MFDFSSCWKRITSVTPIKTLSDLAEIVRTSQSNVSKKKKKDVFPIDWAKLIGEKFGLTEAWIMTGEGNIYRKEVSIDTDLEVVEEDENPNYFGEIECRKNRKKIKQIVLIKNNTYIIDPISSKSKNKLVGKKVKLINFSISEGAEVVLITEGKNKNIIEYFTVDPCDLKQT